MTLSLESRALLSSGASSVERALAEVSSLVSDENTGGVEPSTELNLPDEALELVSGIAPRVDSLIEQLGTTTTMIGDTEYRFSNGGPEVKIGRTYPIELDGHVYTFSEGVTATLSPAGNPLRLVGETGVGQTAFGKSASGEIQLKPALLANRMLELVGSVEAHVHNLHSAQSPVTFPTAPASAA